MAARNPETTLRRDEIVRRFNRGLTQREIATALGLTRGVVGRELAYARAMGMQVIRYTTPETGRRTMASIRANLGEAKFSEYMRERRAGALVARRAKARAGTDEGAAI